MSSLAVMTKTPDDVLDYDVDFERWLSTGDIITAVTATLTDESDGSTIAIDRSSYSDTAAKVWLSGGADGDTACVSVVVTTNDGRTKEACFRIRCKECC